MGGDMSDRVRIHDKVHVAAVNGSTWGIRDVNGDYAKPACGSAFRNFYPSYDPADSEVTCQRCLAHGVTSS